LACSLFSLENSSEAIDVKHELSIGTVNTVLFLLHIGKLGVAKTTDVLVKMIRIYEAFQLFNELFFRRATFSIAPGGFNMGLVPFGNPKDASEFRNNVGLSRVLRLLFGVVAVSN
jgi:hypothetical protein